MEEIIDLKRNRQKTVFVGMSGGVDSSVSAALLKDQGYKVVGVYMDLHSCREGELFSEGNIDSAQKVCDKLEVELKVWNISEKFTSIVVNEFLESYKKGITPNPCITCNKNIKFGEFYKRARKEGADFLATGHYARISKTSFRATTRNLEYNLLRGVDLKKDQSYFLYNLNQEILAHTIFPVGEMTKVEVREIAEKLNLPTAKRSDSQDVCFIKDGDTNKFLRENLRSKKGEIIDVDTEEIVGKHDGLIYYTIGQRKGIKIGSDLPYFVVGKDVKNNQLLVGKGANHPLLLKDNLKVDNLHWISGNEPQYPYEAEVQIRYQQKPIPSTIVDSQTIKFMEPVRAISAGQSAVIYKGEECLGGGVIV